MNIFSTAARLRFVLWSGLAAGLVGTGTLVPSQIHNTNTALTAFGEPGFDLCTETLFTGFPTIAASTMPAVDEQRTSLACTDGGCVDPESVSSQPSAGANAEDMVPENSEEIPVLASLAPLPDVPGLGDPDVTDDPQWTVAGQQPAGGAGSAGKSGNGDGTSSRGGNGGGESEEFVLLPGTGGFNSSPANGGSNGANGGGDGTGDGSGGGGGGGSGGGGSGSGGFGSAGGGSGSTGQGEDADDGENFPFQRLAALGEAPAEVPAPATITLLGLGLVTLARSKR